MKIALALTGFQVERSVDGKSRHRLHCVGPRRPAPRIAGLYKGRRLRVQFLPTLPRAVASIDLASDASPSMREANRKGVRPELRAMDYLNLADSDQETRWVK